MSEKIQVVVRCRTRSRQESAAKSPVVVDLASDSFTAEEPYVTVRNETSSLIHTKVPSAAASKVFKVDQVYGPGADQALLFDNVAAPLFSDFVAGLNVTLLAYGQTGSGKTHTMFGDLQGDNAGIIPRVLSRLFSETSSIDCCVKISCVELYKEELHDLINNDLNLLPVKTKLRLVSEPSRDMGVASVQNLTELTIDSSEMGFRVLQNCLSRRRTGATKLNDLSSRSHTIVSIILYQKLEGDSESEPYKVSKMNLVDLAGSEDIHKSGAVNERAREAGSINQSLLTLGKVISSLSEGKETRHIPYRESKLTRLLQGSIGGKTKTALIATISPAKSNVHETLSTLTYASKAKNIKNLPQSMQSSESVLKKVLVKDLSSQIARLTRDLLASKDKDEGIKMSLQNYQAYGESIRELESNLSEKSSEISRLTQKLEAQASETVSLRQRLEAMEKHSLHLEQQYQEKSSQVLRISNHLSEVTQQYSEQNQKVSQIVQSNVSEIHDMIGTAISDLSSGKTNGSNILGSASEDLVQAIKVSRNKIQARAEQLNASIVSGASSKLSELIQKNLDVASQLKQISSYDVSAEVSNLIDNRKRLRELLEVNAPSDNFSNLLDSSAKELRENSTSIEKKIHSSISQTIKTLLAENEDHNRKTIEAMAKRIYESQNQRACQVVDSTSSDYNALLDGISKKSQDMKKRARTVETDFKNGKLSLDQTLGKHLQQMVGSSIDEITHENSVEARTSINSIQEVFSNVKSKLNHLDDEALSKLRATKAEVRGLQAKVESLKNTTHQSSAAEEVRLERTSSRSPAAKRRRPMSPIKSDNTLYRSRIPQLGHSKH